MRRPFIAVLAAALPMAIAQPVFAAEGMSMFQMFFAPIPSDAGAMEWMGVFMVWGIMLISIITVGLIIKYAMPARRTMLLPEDTRIQVEQMIAEKRYREAIEFSQADPSFLGKVISAALNQASNGFPAMEKAIFETTEEETTKMLRPLEILSILGNVGPMLGLFGTVYGIIVTFAKLVSSGGKPDPGELAGGISTALVTTFWGLIVAMPAMVAYAWLRNHIDAATTDGMKSATEIVEMLKPGGSKKPKPAAAQA